MRKKHLTCTMSEEMIEYAEQLANETGISKSNIPEFALRILETYFTIQQLKLEATVHGPKDGRRGRKKSGTK
jgi:hypothetical protein